MRYSKEENTYILAIFNSGDTVTIDIYRLSDNVKIVSGANCTEISTTGVFKYLFNQTITQKEEYLWIMSNGNYCKYGKIVLGGWMDDIKSKTDKLTFDENNNIEARINDSGVLNVPSVEDIDNRLSNTHGFGSWEGGSGSTSGGGAVFVSGSSINPEDIRKAVWNAKVKEYAKKGTFGYQLQNRVPSENLDDYKADTTKIEKLLKKVIEMISNLFDNIKNIFTFKKGAVKAYIEHDVNLNPESIANIEDSLLNSELNSKKEVLKKMKKLKEKLEMIESFINNLENDGGILEVKVVDKGVLPDKYEIEEYLSEIHGEGKWSKEDNLKDDKNLEKKEE